MIQKVVRGYVVRKTVKKLSKIKAELEEFEMKVNDEETVNKMKKDKNERIGIAESIMKFLLN
ncbi:BAG family molecular chaperone regulator 5 mitochondrial-like, partial [Trifolium medium]|nr:BAG family molecular chaperone regulator 5 mitochondrial-like [Trifolium medium]